MANRTALAFPSRLANSVAKLAKEAIAAQVVSAFADRLQGDGIRRRKPPAISAEERLFLPGTVVRRVHGDVTTMMVGGISGLLLQMLHPAVLAGVWDHSNFRADMQGRLRRTARFIAVTTYGSKSEAEAAIARVRRIHESILGELPSGAAYAASDPKLLAWVHVSETTSFLKAWVRYAEPRMCCSDQDRYFAEMACIAGALGADPIPRSRREARELIEAMRSELKCDVRTRQVARLVLTNPPSNWITAPVQVLGIKPLSTCCLNGRGGCMASRIPPWRFRSCAPVLWELPEHSAGRSSERVPPGSVPCRLASGAAGEGAKANGSGPGILLTATLVFGAAICGWRSSPVRWRSTMPGMTGQPSAST